MKQTKHFKEVLKYCKDIKSKKIPAGSYCRKAVLRFLDDIKNPDLDYELLPDRADEVIDFAESLQIPDIVREDGSKNLQLLPWMKFVYYNIWGFYKKTDSTERRFKFSYIEVARKNSKTTSILFPFILYDFLTTESAESYFVSKDGSQSSKSFKELSHIIKGDKDLKEAVKETVSAITLEHSRISFFSSESVGVDSYKNSLSIIDEYHDYQDDKIITAFKYGGRARKNSGVHIITSAGNNIAGPCFAESQRCKKILNGIMDDEKYFGLIFAYDENDKWNDPKHFIKANPSLHTIIKEEILMDDLNDAIQMPSHSPDFKSKTCGIWTNDKSNWINIDVWSRNQNETIDEKILLDIPCSVALDLSSVLDFTSYTKYFKLENGKYTALHKFYLPEDTLNTKYKTQNIGILNWVEKGFITIIPGSTIDYDYLFEDIKSDYDKYKMGLLSYDAWNSDYIVKRIESEIPLLTTVPYRQQLDNFSKATKQFEKEILDKNIIDNNPVMAWMISNAQIKVDVNGNYKPLKPHKSSIDKIDGVITSIMAYSLLPELDSMKNHNIDYTYIMDRL